MSKDLSPRAVIAHIAKVSEAIGWQAGVGGMETAGSIVSYLDSHPEQIDGFLSGKTSIFDWPPSWHEQGRLTWHGQNGSVVHPEYARQARVIRNMERPNAE